MPKIQALASLLLFSSVRAWQEDNSVTVIKISSTPPANASAPIPEAFVSFSIEFSSFPDFAGRSTHIIGSY